MRQGRQGLLARWREQVRELPSARRLDIPTLNDHMPGLLDELAIAFQSGTDASIPQALAENSAPSHGLQRLQDAFDIQEVVAEYNILRGCVHDLAEDNRLSLQGRPFHTLNRVFDRAIGVALQTYATQRALEVQRRREEYLAFVAHDLRTPLSAISLAGKILEQRPLEAQAREDTGQVLKALRRSVQHLETLVGKVLEENANLQTEMGTKLERREFDLWPFVQALIFDLHPVAGTSSTALISKVPDDLVVYADAELLKRVFQNLIANAIKYTPYGEIVIGALELSADGLIECWVSDNGTGIPEDYRERIFDTGETDPERVGGTGLGLAIVRTFIEAHGGEVSVESETGAGSTFRFTLPCKAHPTGSMS
ncbi:MAG: HAMP domain-containing histidine kinase [Phycisphaerales bacterium]|nr:HAMP domain-containing histidine kinase [Phycisphaerales bacterium]